MLLIPYLSKICVKCLGIFLQRNYLETGRGPEVFWAGRPLIRDVQMREP